MKVEELGFFASLPGELRFGEMSENHSKSLFLVWTTSITNETQADPAAGRIISEVKSRFTARLCIAAKCQHPSRDIKKLHLVVARWWSMVPECLGHLSSHLKNNNNSGNTCNVDMQLRLLFQPRPFHSNSRKQLQQEKETVQAMVVLNVSGPFSFYQWEEQDTNLQHPSWLLYSSLHGSSTFSR